MIETTRKRLTANVRAEAARRQITNVAIAGHLGTNPRAISRRIRGDVEWSAAELVELARVLGVTVEDLTDTDRAVAGAAS